VSPGEILRTALAEVRGHKLRSGLTLLGIILGTLSITIMTSFLDGIVVMVWKGFEDLGFDVVMPPEVEGVSSTAIRAALATGDVGAAAGMLGRPFELDGAVVAGDQRGGTLGYPTANLRLEADLACPRYGIYAGAARDHRAAVSIGRNPHYGGIERRIEPFLLDYEGDLYGQRLVVELWQRLRDEAVFESEEALIEQIARDVEMTRAAQRPGS